MKNIKEEVLKGIECWNRDKTFLFHITQVKKAIDLIQQKMIEDELKFLDKLSEVGYSDYDGDSSLITKREEELKSQVEKGK